jgi:ElaB/YqjD/DUF883 family membrane-anchored ribosome-binding protein
MSASELLHCYEAKTIKKICNYDEREFLVLWFGLRKESSTMKEIVQAESTVAQNGLLYRAINAGSKIIPGRADACIKETLSRVLDDGMTEAKRLIKKSRYRAADVLDETTYRIKRDPLRSVAVTFGIGIGVGMLTGWLVARNGKA